MGNSILDLIAEADKAKAERAAAYPEVASCVEAMVQIRLRQLERELNAANARIAELEQKQEKENSAKSDKSPSTPL